MLKKCNHPLVVATTGAFTLTSLKLLTEQHLEFLFLKGGYTDSPESIHVKMPHCWKSNVAAHILKTEEVTGDSLKYSVMDPIRECCCHRRDQIK